MYPSASHPSYGVFIKNFEESFILNGFTVHKAIIEGRSRSKFYKLFKYIRFFFDVYRNLITKEFDLIYVHYIGHSLLPLVPIQWGLQKPLVINAHGGDVFTASKLGRLIQKFVEPIVKKSALVVVPSSYFEDIVTQRFSIPKENIFISPSGGINTSLFKSPTNRRKKNVFTLGYISRIDEGKGWDVLLNAVNVLVKQNSINIKLIMIGGGAQEAQFVENIKKLGLDKVVNYFGLISQKDLPNFINQMDLFVFPTRLPESLGLVGLEAMACGVPVIGADIGGLKGYIKSGYNGELFEPGNHTELASVINKFIQLDESGLNVYSRNAQVTAQEYDSRKVSEKLLQRLYLLLSSER